VQYLRIFPRFYRLFLIRRTFLIGSENRRKRHRSKNAKDKNGSTLAKFGPEDHKRTPPRTIVEPNRSNSDPIPAGAAAAGDGRGIPKIIS
jgi:hypothetical protein